MNMNTHGMQQGSRVNVDSLSLQRAMIIKKAQESVQASHQRMRHRVRNARV
ncbi:MAG: hypothetical protein LBU45_08280 [Azoarcus sp.]|jgi:hypothetical protein|nr:hypothetical protein [Azoarcus sp.]